MRSLLDAYREPGRYEERWDGRDNCGRNVSSGVYFSRIEAGPLQETKKMVLLR